MATSTPSTGVFSRVEAENRRFEGNRGGIPDGGGLGSPPTFVSHLYRLPGMVGVGGLPPHGPYETPGTLLQPLKPLEAYCAGLGVTVGVTARFSRPLKLGLSAG